MLFPKGYKYLKDYEEKLLARDSDQNCKWFEYGRGQALNHLLQQKLLMSSLVTDKVCVYSLAEQTIPYSGFYIVSIGGNSLDDAILILQSSDFYDYVKDIGISANGNSYRITVHDVMNYLY